MTAYERMGLRVDLAGRARRQAERVQLLAGARFREGDQVAFEARAAGFPYPGEMTGRVSAVEPLGDGRIYYRVVYSDEAAEQQASVVLAGAALRPVDPTEDALTRLASSLPEPPKAA